MASLDPVSTDHTSGKWIMTGKFCPVPVHRRVPDIAAIQFGMVTYQGIGQQDQVARNGKRPRSGQPLGVPNRLRVMPSPAARAFITATQASTKSAASASATEASFAETVVSHQ